MSTALLGQFTFRFAVGGWIVVFFRSLLAFVRLLHGPLAIGAHKTGVVRFVIPGPLFMRLFVVRTRLICRFVVSHGYYQSSSLITTQMGYCLA